MNIFKMEDENLPYRQSMRKSSGLRKGNGYDSWDDYYPRHQYKTYVDRFLEKNIGNNYNDVFSKFLSNLKDKHMSERYISFMKDNFLYAFNSQYWQSYEIDEDGNIQKAKNEGKSRDLVLYTEKPYIVYKLKEKFKPYADKLIQLIGHDKYNRICNGYVPLDAINVHRHAYEIFFWYVNEQDRNLIPYYMRSNSIMALFDCKNISDSIVLEYGTPEYCKYMAEKNDAENKEIRDNTKKSDEIVRHLLHDIEAFRKCKENMENDAKIVKHGFDPKISFRSVPKND
ncbi:MAG: hypothetical protein [Wendovervirus sonii]|uniref:Uncharacterized protein n=1 Tax=phage Lak_Megaphage_Sonny TaxID=3109229 RepID=A0ABZ0Z567_9CAUD|nr:MAG: hypothetical protein [phage Lak_Megaphage_Sonny]